MEKCKHGLMKISCQICNPQQILKPKPKTAKVKISKPRCQRVTDADRYGAKPMPMKKIRALCKAIRKDYLADYKHDFGKDAEPCIDVWWEMAKSIIYYSEDGPAILARFKKDNDCGGYFPSRVPMNKELCSEILADMIAG